MEAHQICSRKTARWRCKNISGDNEVKYCEKHYKKMEEMEERNMPSDEQFCCLTGGGGWRCKNLRMSHGAAADGHNSFVPKTKFCEKHYYYYAEKNRSIRSGDSGSKRRKKVDDETEIQKLGATRENNSDTIMEKGGTANTRRKRKNVERTESSAEPESSTRTRDTAVELESLEHYKSKCFELSVELEKKKVECAKLQGELVDVVEARETSATEEMKQTPADSTQCWKKMFSDLESLVLKIQNEISTMVGCVETRMSKLENLVLRIENETSTVMGCLESRISILESLLPRSTKEGSILRYIDLCDSVNIESQARGLQNDVTQSGEKQRGETSSGRRESFHLYDLKTKEDVLSMYENVEEGKGWGCSEERPSQHGSPSQDHLEMSNKPYVNLVLDDGGECPGESEDFNTSADSEFSLGLMDMTAMNNWNWNIDQEIKWEFEADMLSSFEEDTELSMKAVCALYRQHIAKVEISTKGLFHDNDVLRATTLAKFLMDGDCKGGLMKSAKELEKFDSEGVEDCKRLARSYSKQLFSIYQSRNDPFFLPATTASDGDQTAQ